MNRNTERVADLLAAGGVQASSPAQVAESCEVLFICVTGSPQVEQAMDGVLEAAHQGLVVVDCSTSEPDSTTRQRGRALAHGVTFVDAPLARTPVQADAVGQRAGVDPKQLVSLVSQGPVNNGLFQAMAKTLDGQLDGLRFELDNARKDVRYYTHLAENLAIPSVMGEAVHQSLALASALGHGRKYVPSLVEAQEQLSGATLVPRQGKT